MLTFRSVIGFLTLPLMILCLVLTFTGQRTRQRMAMIVALDFMIAFCSICAGYYINAIIWGAAGSIGVHRLKGY